MIARMPTPFTELSVVRLRIAKTDDEGRSVETGSNGTIVYVQPTGPDKEPAYIVEIPRSPALWHRVDARHGELVLVKPFVPVAKTPWLSRILFGGACLAGVASVVSIDFCGKVLRTSSWGGALAFNYFLAPLLIILTLALIAVPSGILFKSGRRRLDLSSLLLSGATVVVTIIEVVVLSLADMRGS